MSARQVMTETLAALEFRDAISAICGGVRRIDESDQRTVERIAEERGQLVRLLRELEIEHRRWGDYEFKEFPGPVGALRKHLGLGEDPGPQARRARADQESTFEYAERMSVLWAEEAARRKEQGK